MCNKFKVYLGRACLLFSFVLVAGSVEAVTESFPIDLTRTTKEEVVIVNVYKPSGAVNGLITLSTYDADNMREGELVINGNAPIVLFGRSAAKENDKSLADIIISTPASYWNDGDNTLLFRHKRSAGYSIHGVSVFFEASNASDASDPRPIAALSDNSIDFGGHIVGGISDPIEVTLANSGAVEMNISRISVSSGFTESNNCNSRVPAGGDCVFSIQFVPTEPGTGTGELTITADDAVGSHTISLSGFGIDNAVDTLESFPVELFGTTPEEATAVVNVYKPAGAINGLITLSAYDADSPGEGELVINGNSPIALFGSSGVKDNNQSLADITISTPASYWNDGDNTLLFRHTSTAGYSINGVTVLFDASSTPASEPVAKLSSSNVDFGGQVVGGTSDPVAVTLTNNGAAPMVISGISVPSGFAEANNCNNYVPEGGSCTIDIQFIPLTSGSRTGMLSILSNATNSPADVSLSGIGIDGAQSRVTSGNDLVFNVDFENRQSNTAYTEAQLIEDFNANNNDGRIHGPDYGNTRIVSDPEGNTGRGNVLRSRHRAGQFGIAVSFKARFAPDNENKSGSARYDDVYLSYDIYLSKHTERMPFHKIPGMITGTMLEASHKGTYLDPISHAEPEGVKSFTAYLQMFNSAVYSNRPDGVLSVTYYDAEKTQKMNFLDTVNPSEGSANNSYVMPLGEWVTIEERVKMNTADSNDNYDSSVDLKDGLVEVWINGTKMLSKVHLWRHTDTMKVDGFWFRDYYNDRPDLTNPPSNDQYVYYDNFRVSTSPITH